MHDPFLNDIYTSNDAEEYFSKIVGEEMRWLSNSWDASHMNVQEKTGLDTKIFDWHMDSQPLTLIINVSDMPPPEEIIGGSTILRKHDDGTEIELKQPAPGKYKVCIQYSQPLKLNYEICHKNSKTFFFQSTFLTRYN